MVSIILLQYKNSAGDRQRRAVAETLVFLAKIFYDGVMNLALISERLGKWALYALALAPLIFIPTVLFPSLIPRLGWIFGAILVLVLAATVKIFVIKALPVRWNKIDFAVCLFAVVLIITALFGVDVQNSLWSEAGRTVGVVYWLMMFGAYFALRILSFTERVRGQALLVTVGALLIVSVIGLLQEVGAIPTDQGQRVEGLFGNALIFGYYLAPFILLVSTAFFLRAKYYYAQVVLLIAAVVFAGLSLLFSQTRGAGLGLVAGLAVIFYKYFLQTKTTGVFFKKNRWIIGLGTLVLLIGLGATILNPGARSFVVGLSRISSIETRLINWKVAARGIREHPILGWGWENYRSVADVNFDAAFGQFSLYETRVDKPHNAYLEVLVTTGVVGLLSYLILIYFVFSVLWGPRETAFFSRGMRICLLGSFVAYLIQNIFGFDTQMSLVYFLFILWLAGDLLQAEQKQPERASLTTNNPAFKTAAILLTGLTTSIFWYGAVLPFRSAFYLQTALDGLAVRDYKAVDAAFRSERAWPQGPYFFESWRWMGHALLSPFAFGVERVNDLPPNIKTVWSEDVAVIIELTEQYGRQYQNSAQWQMFVGKIFYQLGVVLGDKKYFILSDAALRRVLVLSPARDEARLLLASVAIQLDNLSEAVDFVLAADSVVATDSRSTIEYLAKKLADSNNLLGLIKLYEGVVKKQPTAEYYAHLAVAYATVGRSNDARAAVERAVEIDPAYRAEAEIFLKQLKNK